MDNDNKMDQWRAIYFFIDERIWLLVIYRIIERNVESTANLPTERIVQNNASSHEKKSVQGQI